MLYVYGNDDKYFKFTVSNTDKFDIINRNGNYSYTEVELIDDDFTKLNFYKFDEENNEWVFDNDAYISSKKQNYLDVIKKVAADLTANAPYLILPDISKEQVDAYKVKYDQAKIDNTAFFEYEAKVTGMDVEDLINIVLENGKVYEDMYNDLIGRIEGMRRGAKLLTYGEKFDNVDRALIFMKNLSNDLTYQMFLDYVSGEVDTIGDLAPLNDDGTVKIESVITIIGFVPEETV